MKYTNEYQTRLVNNLDRFLAADNETVKLEMLTFQNWTNENHLGGKRLQKIQSTNDAIKRRLKIANYADNGRLYLICFSRDCDLMERTWLSDIPATIHAYNVFENDLYDNAEGATSISIVTIEEARDFEPSWFDRAAAQMNY